MATDLNRVDGPQVKRIRMGDIVLTPEAASGEVVRRLTDFYGLSCNHEPFDPAVADWFHELREASELVPCQLESDEPVRCFATCAVEVMVSGPITNLRGTRIGTYVDLRTDDTIVFAPLPVEALNPTG